LAEHLGGGRDEAEFLAKHWKNHNIPVTDSELKCYPLHIAANNSFLDAAGLLLEKGANVDVGDDFSRTPLHYAARKGNTQMSALLLDKNAYINVLTGPRTSKKCGYGSTPLHMAVKSGNLQVVEFLIKNGAEINVIRSSSDIVIVSGMRHHYSDGTTPLDLARTDEIKRLLREHGAMTYEELPRSN
ncbi:MAG: ankyrin repeat domain-containing protein, partial [Planctomycetota bacterium]